MSHSKSAARTEGQRFRAKPTTPKTTGKHTESPEARERPKAAKPQKEASDTGRVAIAALKAEHVKQVRTLENRLYAEACRRLHETKERHEGKPLFGVLAALRGLVLEHDTAPLALAVVTFGEAERDDLADRLGYITTCSGVALRELGHLIAEHVELLLSVEERQASSRTAALADDLATMTEAAREVALYLGREARAARAAAEITTVP